jgi:hypothetical protein
MAKFLRCMVHGEKTELIFEDVFVLLNSAPLLLLNDDRETKTVLDHSF